MAADGVGSCSADGGAGLGNGPSGCGESNDAGDNAGSGGVGGGGYDASALGGRSQAEFGRDVIMRLKIKFGTIFSRRLKANVLKVA